MTLSEAASSDVFFFHDTMDVSLEIEADLLAALMQDRGALFYDRAYGSGVEGYENRPAGLVADVLLPFAVVSMLGLRNRVVSDGGGGAPDRRVATSQSQVVIERSGAEVNVSVNYVEMRDLARLRTASTPLGKAG